MIYTSVLGLGTYTYIHLYIRDYMCMREDDGGIENLSPGRAEGWGREKNCSLKASVRRKEECLSRPVCSTYKEVISPGVEFPSSERSLRASLFLFLSLYRYTRVIPIIVMRYASAVLSFFFLAILQSPEASGIFKMRPSIHKYAYDAIFGTLRYCRYIPRAVTCTVAQNI